METSRARHALALAIVTVAFAAGTCTEEKVVDLVIGFSTTVTLVAEGEINTHSDTGVVNVKEDLDLEAELAKAGIDPSTLDKDAVKIAQVSYRVIAPDPVANRRITDGMLTVVQVDESTGGDVGTPAVLVSGWSMNAGSGNVPDREAWIDITADIGADGIALLNAYLEACLCELRGEIAAVPNPEIRYTVSGNSVPADRETNFRYQIRILFQGKVPRTFEIPFG